MKSTTSYSRMTSGYGGRKLSAWIIVLALSFSIWIGVFYALHSILT